MHKCHKFLSPQAFKLWETPVTPYLGIYHHLQLQLIIRTENEWFAKETANACYKCKSIQRLKIDQCTNWLSKWKVKYTARKERCIILIKGDFSIFCAHNGSMGMSLTAEKFKHPFSDMYSICRARLFSKVWVCRDTSIPTES